MNHIFDLVIEEIKKRERQKDMPAQQELYIEMPSEYTNNETESEEEENNIGVVEIDL